MAGSFRHRVPFRAWLLIVFGLCFAISAIRPLHPFDFVVEHTFTLGLLAFLLGLEKWSRPLSNTSCALLFVYMLLHVVGAHYTYSLVPYDAWAEALLGRDITTTFGFERNHYDRVVHLGFGLLLVKPVGELISRWMPLGNGQALFVTVLVLATLSKVYELIEWLFAIIMSPDAAELYNGQQGDMFDAHKDMGLALVGAMLAALILWLRGRGDRDSGTRA